MDGKISKKKPFPAQTWKSTMHFDLAGVPSILIKKTFLRSLQEKRFFFTNFTLLSLPGQLAGVEQAWAGLGSAWGGPAKVNVIISCGPPGRLGTRLVPSAQYFRVHSRHEIYTPSCYVYCAHASNRIESNNKNRRPRC